MRARRFSCNWVRKNGAMMMMSREVRSFTRVCFSVLFLSLAESLLAHRSAGREQPQVTTHLTRTWTSISTSDSWQMKNAADCSSDNYWCSSVYDLYSLRSLWGRVSNLSAFCYWPKCVCGTEPRKPPGTESWHRTSGQIHTPVYLFIDQIFPYLNPTFKS